MRPGALVCLGMSAVLAACGGSSQPAPTPSPGPVGTTIRGTERLGWDQLAAGRAQLGSYRYAIYVDGMRSEIADVLCAAAGGPAGFACSGRMPPMTPGGHTLELATFVLDGGAIIESPRSTPLQVVVSPGLAAPVTTPSSDPAAPAPTPDESPVAAVTVSEGFTDIADIGVTPDGRLLVAERGGMLHSLTIDGTQSGERLRQAVEGTAAAGGTGALLAIALDPEYARTGILYLLQTGPARNGDLTFQVVRYRAALDRLGERAVILESGQPDAARPHGVLKVGGDGRLYVGMFDAAGMPDPADGPPMARRGMRGAILRLNPDGSTPADQPGSSPLFAASQREPRGLDWQPASGDPWVALDGGDAPARAVALADGRRDGAGARFEEESSLAPASHIRSMRFYDGDAVPSLRGALLVAGDNGLFRVRFDPADGSRIHAIDRLLAFAARAVAFDPEGLPLVASADRVVRLSVR